MHYYRHWSSRIEDVSPDVSNYTAHTCRNCDTGWDIACFAGLSVLSEAFHVHVRAGAITKKGKSKLCTDILEDKNVQ